MRHKDLITGLLVIFWIVFIFIVPIFYGLGTSISLVLLFSFALTSMIVISPFIIIKWYDEYYEDRWLDKKIKLKNEKYFY